MNVKFLWCVLYLFILDYKLFVDERDIYFGNLNRILYMKYLEMKWKM